MRRIRTFASWRSTWTADRRLPAVARSCWGVLEMHWNGALLDTVEKALHWAETMTWKGVGPVVRLLDRVYHTGVKLAKAALRPYSRRLCRSKELPKWSVTIKPEQPVAGCVP